MSFYYKHALERARVGMQEWIVISLGVVVVSWMFILFMGWYVDWIIGLLITATPLWGLLDARKNLKRAKRVESLSSATLLGEARNRLTKHTAWLKEKLVSQNPAFDQSWEVLWDIAVALQCGMEFEEIQRIVKGVCEIKYTFDYDHATCRRQSYGHLFLWYPDPRYGPENPKGKEFLNQLMDIWLIDD